MAACLIVPNSASGVPQFTTLSSGDPDLREAELGQGKGAV